MVYTKSHPHRKTVDILNHIQYPSHIHHMNTYIAIIYIFIYHCVSMMHPSCIHDVSINPVLSTALDSQLVASPGPGPSPHPADQWCWRVD